MAAAGDFYSLLNGAAQEFGFPLSGALDLDLSLETFHEHSQRYASWIDSGFHGEMGYLERGKDRRLNPRLVFPEAQSMLCVAQPYGTRLSDVSEGRLQPRYARYLSGKDYHLDIQERLEKVMNRVQENWSTPLSWKVCVDTSAVLERSWASLAGLGWIGKNTLLIHPKHGSYLFLGEVLISEKTGRGPTPLPNFCGNCSRCLSACPTEAFVEPGRLNSKRCISYWTLEKRGELDSLLGEEDRRKMGTWVAGCDICQEVCPFNMKPSREHPLNSSPGLVIDWAALLSEPESDYRLRTKNSALDRVKPAQFRRNLAIALANAVRESEPEARQELIQSLRSQVESAAEVDADLVARTEWRRCLETFRAFS